MLLLGVPRLSNLSYCHLDVRPAEILLKGSQQWMALLPEIALSMKKATLSLLLLTFLLLTSLRKSITLKRIAPQKLLIMDIKLTKVL